MKQRKPVKALVITLCVALGLGAAGFGAWKFLPLGNTEPVSVYAFEFLGMTEYWGDSRESYGPVRTDRVQTVLLSDTQTVTEVLVQEGDTVRKGDVLMRFDTTLTDIALERERLEVEKVKLKLTQAQKELNRIAGLKPSGQSNYVPPETQPADPGQPIGGAYELSTDQSYDGSTPEKALILWLRSDSQIDDALLEAARATAQQYQQANAPTVPPAPEETEPPTDAPTTVPTVPPAPEETEPPTDAPTTVPTEPPAPEETEPPTDAPTTVPTEPPTPEETEPPTDAPTTVPTVPSAPEETEPPTEAPTTVPTEAPATEPTQPTPLTVDHFFLVVKTTQDDVSTGAVLTYQGMEVTRTAGGSFRFRFFDGAAVPDHMHPPKEEPESVMPAPDTGSGYTAAQIAQMRAQQEKTVRDLQFQVKTAEGKYQIKCKEVQSGDVVATFDGIVVSLLTEEEARKENLPVMKISGGGGFYVQGSVSELQKDTLLPGMRVTVNDWNTGMTYEGVVRSVGDFPTGENGWNGVSNPNVSYYPFEVFVDESADLQEGSYVSVVYANADAQQGIYLQNPFLRTEQGRSYVYAQGADGKLEKRYVTTGKNLWGSYTQILEGVTAEDFLAFPYGKNLVEGADTLQSDSSELYR